MTTLSSSYSTLVGVYAGTSLNSLTPVASNSSAGNGMSGVSFTAQAGTTYEVTVDGQNGASGLTILGINYANDAFETPATLSGASVGVTASNVNASREAGELPIRGIGSGHSLWYQWTPPATARYEVSAFSPDFDPVFEIYTGTSVNHLSQISGAEGSTISTSATTPASTCTCSFTGEAGTTYLIGVDGNLNVDSNTGLVAGQFTLSIADAAWQFTAGDSITCTPAVGNDGTVYIGSDDGYFYSFGSNGASKWKYKTGGALDTSSASLSSDGSTVYAASEDGSLYAFATSKGARDWRELVARPPPACSPTLGADGTIYVKDSGNNLYALTPAGAAQVDVPGTGHFLRSADDRSRRHDLYRLRRRHRLRDQFDQRRYKMDV